ncbi:choice-of-anchor L domain-containing protein [Flavobacterium antarcticum]|uniref:choice-of-anchor L domain-containing protein n=1 Tax=Flavobacterium antarcticum TaxID=271155 RepID=UPI0039EE8508
MKKQLLLFVFLITSYISFAQVPSADIVSTMTNNQTEYLINETVEYIITVKNLGPNSADNVVVNNPIPAGLNASQMTWSSSTGLQGTGAMTETIPVLPVGVTITYSVFITVPANYTGALINNVTVNTTTLEYNYNNNNSNDSDQPRPDFVTIDSGPQGSYTITQLIKEVLINEPCVQLTGFTSSGTTDAAKKGFGAFKRNNSNFPFKEGVIIRSGDASKTQGKYNGSDQGTTGSGDGQGDSDLDIINGLNSDTNDRSFVQFDFIPTVEKFSFKFLFASNEYGTYQCTFGDTFAFILTKLDSNGNPTGVPKNLAVVPGSVTAADPDGERVSVVTIRDAAYNGGCSSENAAFFDRYNASGTGPNAGPASSAINMIGQTTPMTAAATVIPGTSYRIKLVIADHQDTNFDSAVFLEAGSFTIGGPRITGTGIHLDETNFTDGSAFCEGTPQTIQAGTGPVAGVTYSWLKDGVLIPGATSYSLQVTEPGTYTVIFSYGNGCTQSDEIVVEFTPGDYPLMAEANDLTSCTLFNLTVNEPVVMASYNQSEFITYYYTTLEAAQALDPEAGALSDAEKVAFAATSSGQEIWMKMFNEFFGGVCDPIKSFKLYPVAAPSGTFSYPDDNDGVTGFCINSNNNLLPTTVALTSGGDYTATPAGLTINGTTGGIDLFNSLANTYTITYTINAADCPPYSYSQQVQVVSCVGTTASNSGNVCVGTPTFNLFATDAGAGATYEWSFNGVPFSTDQNPTGVSVPTTAGDYVYSVIATINGSPSNPSLTTLTVHPKPTASFVSTSTTICTNASTTLLFSGTPGALVTFSDGTTTYPVTLDATGNGSFDTPALGVSTTFTLVDVTGTTTPACVENLNASILISVGLPTASIVKFTDAVICSGTATGLEITGTPGSTVTYTKDGVTQATVEIPASGSFTIPTGVQTVTATTSYTYELTNVQSNSTPPCSDAITGQSAVLTVNALPTATMVAVNTTICEGTKATLNFNGTPNATVTYNNGTANATITLDATGNASFDTPLLSTETTYTLVSVEVTNTVLCSQTLTGNVVISINKNPVITTQPAGATICVNTNNIFSVAATGDGLAYQWFFNGTLIPGAISINYTVTNATVADAGDYTVEVSGICGTPVLSDPATLVITQVTNITVQPQASTTVCAGQPINLSVTATGTNLTYQWFKGATLLTGETNTTLNITSATTTSAGIYTVVITNPCQSVTSTTAEVIVNELPAITGQPQGTTICEGQGINFSVTASGTGITYQWYLNGTLLPGETANTYSDATVTLAEAGNYTVTVSGICAPAVTSAPAVVNVNQGATFTQQPVPTTIVCSGEPVTLSVATTGGTGVSYQWFKNGNPIAGATATTFTLTASTVADSGDYVCQVTVASCGVINSNTASVTVNQAPGIATQPTNKEICVGSTTMFYVGATGTNLTYQWYKGTTAIPGEITDTYTIQNATEADSGSFYCEITSASCPNIKTVTVTLLVKPLPFATIAEDTPSTICAGQSTQVVFNGTPGAVVIYTINGGTPETITLNAGVPTILPTGILNETTVYELVSVTYTGPDACSQPLTGSATVVVNPLPKVSLEDGYICIDPITLATTRPYPLDTQLNEGEYTFEWFDANGTIAGATKTFYDAVEVGQYGVTITNIITLCQQTAYANVDSSAPPTDFTYAVSGYFAENPTIVITATPMGNYEYQLDNGPFQESNVFDNVTMGTHFITVRDPQACDVLTKSVLIVDYPKYFTPNGDGIKDTWNISSIRGISISKIYIFDRFGKLLKEMSTSGSGWDGTYNGQLLPAADYWFTINYQEAGINKEFRAHFSLKR